MDSVILYPQIPLASDRMTRVEKVFARVRAFFPGALLIRDAGHFLDAVNENALQNKKILLLCALDEVGMNDVFTSMRRLMRLNPHCMDLSVCALMVDGAGEFDTKDLARDAAYDMNNAGCMLMSRCLAEGTGSLLNYELRAEKEGCSLEEAYMKAADWIAKRLRDFEPVKKASVKLLCVNAGDKKTSNTMKLWSFVKEELGEEILIREINLRDGALPDCRGCGVKGCTYFSESKGCYYGGIMVEEVYPALLECDALVMLAPNYNDALSANLTAMINRMTALSSKEEFVDKYLFGVIVSGYSGSDLLMRQMIGALSMNRSFILPGRFAIAKTAYHPGDLEHIKGVSDEAHAFARHMRGVMLLNG